MSAARYQKHFDELASDPAASATPTALAEPFGRVCSRPGIGSRSRPAGLIIKLQQGEAEVRESTGDWASRTIQMMLVLGVLGLLGSALVALAVIGSLKRLSHAPRLQVHAVNPSAALHPWLATGAVGRTMTVLHSVGENFWLVDGPVISVYGLPFPTRWPSSA